MRTNLFLESNQNQPCFNVEIYRQINVDKSTLNQRKYYVDRRRDLISTHNNVESTLSVCWEITVLNQGYSKPIKICSVRTKVAGYRSAKSNFFTGIFQKF